MLIKDKDKYYISKDLLINNNLITKESIITHLDKTLADVDIHIFKTIPSTNDKAKEFALNGAKNGTVIIAEEQSAGKGRMGRSFYSPANTGIYMSIILRPKLTSMDSVLVTTAASVCICNAIYKTTGIQCEIKWINDIYINNKKVAGILTEASTNSQSGIIDYLILGIGINFNKPKDNFPNEIKNIATSLFDNDSNGKTRNILCAEIINSILNMIPNIKSYDFISEYKKRSTIMNKDIVYTISGNSFVGKVIDINNDGSLIIKDKYDNMITINSSEVTIRRLN